VASQENTETDAAIPDLTVEKRAVDDLQPGTVKLRYFMFT
jgi:hypothetical protein